jgi:hypothetical protein
MTCDRMLPIIEEYVDNELDAATRRSVDEHLAACPKCAAHLVAVEREQALFARYDRGFEPSAHIWEAVQARIEREAPDARRSGGWFRSLTAWLGDVMTPSQLIPVGAAALAIAVSIAVGVAFWNRPDTSPEIVNTTVPAPPPNSATPVDPTPPTDERPAEVAVATDEVGASRTKKARPRTPPPPSAPSLPVPVADAEQRYLRAIALLTKDIDQAAAGLDANVKAEWQKPLDAIDRNIVEARRAVEKNPDDPVAVLTMLSAYDSKVETLQTMALLTADKDR